METKRGVDNGLSTVTSKRTGVGRKQLNGEINSISPNRTILITHFHYHARTLFVDLSTNEAFLLSGHNFLG